MTKEQYDDLQFTEQAPPFIKGSSLKNQENRTLLYGYTTSRDTWHVYLYQGEIFVVVYSYGEHPLVQERVMSNVDYVPDKRLYPGSCDYEFCKLLKEADVYLSFTSFEDDKQTGWRGLVLSQHEGANDE